MKPFHEVIMYCGHFQLGVVYMKKRFGLLLLLLFSLGYTSKWQRLGSLITNPISSVHQGTFHILSQKQENKEFFDMISLDNPRVLKLGYAIGVHFQASCLQFEMHFLMYSKSSLNIVNSFLNFKRSDI